LPGKATVRIEEWKPQEHYCHDKVATRTRRLAPLLFFSFSALALGTLLLAVFRDGL
jgi:hypothetical protein